MGERARAYTMRSRRSRAVWLIVLAAGTTYYYFGLFLPQVRAVRTAKELYGPYTCGGDFYPVWLTSRELLFHRGNPYSRGMTRQIQAGFFGRPLEARKTSDPPANSRAFSYPLYVDFLAAPAAFLSFRTVQYMGAVTFPLLIAASVILWFRGLEIPAPDSIASWVALVLISYPVLEGLYALQVSVIVFFLVSASVAAIAAARYGVAGVLLALATGKPQLSALLILLLLAWVFADWRSRGRLVFTFALAILVFLIVSFAVMPGWFFEWWRALLEYRGRTEPAPLAQLLFGKYAGRALGILLLGWLVWIAGKARRLPFTSPGFTLAIATVLAVTVILVPSSVAVYDHVLLLPGLLWLWHHRNSAGRRPAVRWLLGIMWLALAWQWLAASGVSAASLIWPALRNHAIVILLPLRTAPALPFVVAAALGIAALNRFARSQKQAPASLSAAESA